ncbi:MAG: hypothetical protein HYZ53_24610 [Planctomycetes bacterium]|nr:hypothetical protein [Planctomycetota bacterium]
MSNDPLVGTTLGGDYRIVRLLGAGGMGAVYLAEQVSLNRHVAVKLLSGSFLATHEAVERFRREGRAAARLHFLASGRGGEAIAARYEAAMKMGEYALSKGDFETAESKFGEALAARPADRAATEAGERSREAREVVERREAERKRAEAAAARQEVARLRAEEDARRAVETSYRTAMGKGEEALAAGEFDRANEGFGAALSARPGDAKALDGQDRVRAARAAAERKRQEDEARRAEETKYGIAMAKGEAAWGAGKFDEADARFAEALALRPGDPKATEALSRVKAARAKAEVAAAAGAKPGADSGAGACGSWDADDRWGFEGGRIYATALNTLTLEVYYRYESVLSGQKRK